MAYRMILNETSYFGPGSIRCIVDEVKKRGFKKALVVTDKDLIRLTSQQKFLLFSTKPGCLTAFLMKWSRIPRLRLCSRA